MDKGKIMNELEQKMRETYLHVEVLQNYGALALKLEGKVIARFKDWDPHHYYIECGPELAEKALSNGILLDFYKEGRKLLKKPIPKYKMVVDLPKSKWRVSCSDGTIHAWKGNFLEEKCKFTKAEINEMKSDPGILLDWDRVRLEEVNDE